MFILTNVRINSYKLSFCRIEHQKIHEKHKGHDKMHAEMVLILILTLIVAQVLLIEWKKRHYRSYSVSITIPINMLANLRVD